MLFCFSLKADVFALNSQKIIFSSLNAIPSIGFPKNLKFSLGKGNFSEKGIHCSVSLPYFTDWLAFLNSVCARVFCRPLNLEKRKAMKIIRKTIIAKKRISHMKTKKRAKKI